MGPSHSLIILFNFLYKYVFIRGILSGYFSNHAKHVYNKIQPNIKPLLVQQGKYGIRRLATFCTVYAMEGQIGNEVTPILRLGFTRGIHQEA